MKGISSKIIAMSLVLSGSSSFALNIPATEDTSFPVLTGAFNGTAGKAKTVAVSPKSTGLVKFDLTGFDMSAATIERAKLRLYISSVTKTGDLEIRSVASGVAGNWSEDAGKGVAAPTINSTGGATVNLSDKRKRFITVEVTDLVKSWLTTPTSNNGVAILSKGGAVSVLLGSKEGFGVGYPAELEIESNAVLPLFSGGNPATGKLNGASIANATITTTQIANSAITTNLIANGSVGLEKLFSRGFGSDVSEGNVATEKLNDVTTSSTNGIDIGISNRIVTTGRPVLIMLVPFTTANAVDAFWFTDAATVDGYSFMELTCNGTSLGKHLSGVSQKKQYTPISTAVWLHQPTAGTQEYRINLGVNNSANTVQLGRMRIVVFEL